MSFHRTYQVGDRMVAVVPSFTPEGNLPDVANGNAGRVAAWRSSMSFKLVESTVTGVIRDNYARNNGPQLTEVIGSGVGEWAPYWSLNLPHLLSVLAAINANVRLTDEAKRFIMRYSLPQTVISGPYASLLRDISRAANLSSTAVPSSVEAVRAEAASLGIILMTDSELAEEAQQPAPVFAETADQLDQQIEAWFDGRNPASVAPMPATGDASAPAFGVRPYTVGFNEMTPDTAPSDEEEF